MRTLFITGTDTNVGKTWVTCTLLKLLESHGIAAGGSKPVCSGAEFHSDGSPFWADVDALRTHCSLNPPESLVCPRRFLAPLAPNLAAKLENSTITRPELLAAVSAWKTHCQLLLIEGAGGLYCPLSDDCTVLDLIQELQTPTVIIAANRLGVISHTRMTAELLQRSNSYLLGIILNDVQPPADRAHDLSAEHNASQLRHWLPEIPLLHSEWNSRNLALVSPGSQKLADVHDWVHFISNPPDFALVSTPAR
jgi:dethiobiotin synthetase